MATFVGVVLSCLECGEIFKAPQCRSKTAKYCSKECADVHRQDATRVKKIGRTCLRCGKEFYDHPCHSERRKYCSYECANKEFEARAAGTENNKNFYDHAFWKELRALVLERDSFRCQNCGKNKGLEVHHIQPKRAGGADVEVNLLSLCPPCRRSKHKNYEYLRPAACPS